ncbi:chemotaxis protein CheB [Chitinimonas sp. BJB300]|uniref:chemotaxis protein CheB n=1 Tax=Chitinimonas sp. BJB300 TaxID=1559339 RepID=UPI000C12235F|nr:chemotaxis protein CheB [Chitinimonas sp. BJB300]PHV10586.1 chemotaxis protein CheB [Chitinimonas sp. BJB300]TSJ87500.1 chemotaxis protein CheB [Chitinimonas sp. BJB300]
MAKSTQSAKRASSEVKKGIDDLTTGVLNTPAFPIVGIGCSAGGLEALEKFLTHTPAHTGIAFVIVQHLAPAYTSALPELLQRSTTMSVFEVSDSMRVVPDCVYVIPPGKNLLLQNGMLYLRDPIELHGLRLPIDFFLRALAEEQQERAIGVILSGMGSDGVAGLRAIKEKMGLCLAQEPASASADSMPHSAIEAGVVDIIAPAEQLPEEILVSLKLPARITLASSSSDTEVKTNLGKIIVLLRNRCHNDFSLYKSNTLERRIERRIALHRLSSIANYVHYLRTNPQEIDQLFKELLIGVTNFFRDADVWAYFRDEAIPALLAQHPEGKPLRAWVAACSSGEEAYSLAIVLKEALEVFKPNGRFEFQIYATDLDPDAISKARKGLFPSNIEADVSPERLARYFVSEADGYRIKKEIREMVVFATQNIISDPPFTKLDILCCRNLLIYFGTPLQKKLLPLFHYALNPSGLLLLGSAESAGHGSHLFAPIKSKVHLFRRLDQRSSASEMVFPGKTPGPVAVYSETLPVERMEPDENIGLLTDQLIQQNYAPAAVLVDSDGDILYISGRTGAYLEPAAGKVNINIHAMAREGLREALVGVIRKALRDPQPIQLQGLQIPINGSVQIVNVTVRAIENPLPLRGLIIIVFSDVATPKTTRMRRKSASSSVDEVLQQELRQARDALQAMHEEMQSSMEELRSSNEELQSTNEELQSTNEELTTSKEEMQSLNEELQTVNAELQSKMEDLTGVKNDMTNLLNSTEIATIFLDGDMKLRRFTSHTTRLFKLIPSDVGRPFSDVMTDLDYPELKNDAHDVLSTLIFQETQAGTNDGRWYRVRIMPYRTQDNVIDGVVITFTDISELKLLETQLQHNQL